MHAHSIVIELYVLEDVLLGLVPQLLSSANSPFSVLKNDSATALPSGVPGGDLRGGSAAGLELDHRLCLLLKRDRVRLRVRPPYFLCPGASSSIQSQRYSLPAG